MARRQLVAQTAILRQALFCNVQPRQHLDARGHALAHRQGWTQPLLQLTIDANANAVDALIGLEVQIRSAQRMRPMQEPIEQTHHRTVVGQSSLEQSLQIGLRRKQRRSIHEPHDARQCGFKA